MNQVTLIFVRMLSIASAALLLLSGCRQSLPSEHESSCRYARHFDIVDITDADGLGKSAVIIIPSHGGKCDTLLIDKPLDNIICMSSSYVACLSEIGMDSVITAVSGLRYITDSEIRSRASMATIYDVGYETSLDYERIISLNPDLLVTYTVSSAEPPYIMRLRSMGVPVLVLHDHLEAHPLARAEYMRLFGALTGCREKADSVFDDIAGSYEALKATVRKEEKKRVLMNIPYGDAWYVPGNESYMANLVRDAGGEVLGAADGETASDVISMEKAYLLSQEADIWLNPGHCDTRAELSSIHQLFSSFGPLKNGLPIYNNTLRTTPEGGNDFWESGAVRPDLVLHDLLRIFENDSSVISKDPAISKDPVISSEVEKSLYYFKSVD
ncbi:MAG: ABC transporter substrate-binding protein [Bacteroidales bacterium]|nr:ABC transporter substrate-binding protein [Bacteroidales bacterium]MBQ8839682.1 ABC transporter substrate-binding protein [Bacteroidales bacterium]